jgi:predicted permease
MVEVFFGQQAIPYAVLYDQLGSFLALATYGSVILAIYASANKAPSIKNILIKVISFPPFIALSFSLFFTLFFEVNTYPAVISHLLEILAATLVPLVMVAVGFQLTLKLNKALLGHLSIGLSIKLLFIPILALLSCNLLGLTGEVVSVSIFESAMPPMISAGALAIMANLAPKLAAGLVGYGILLSFISLPLIYQLL